MEILIGKIKEHAFLLTLIAALAIAGSYLYYDNVYLQLDVDEIHTVEELLRAPNRFKPYYASIQGELVVDDEGTCDYSTCSEEKQCCTECGSLYLKLRSPDNHSKSVKICQYSQPMICQRDFVCGDSCFYNNPPLSLEMATEGVDLINIATEKDRSGQKYVVKGQLFKYDFEGDQDYCLALSQIHTLEELIEKEL